MHLGDLLDILINLATGSTGDLITAVVKDMLYIDTSVVRTMYYYELGYEVIGILAVGLCIACMFMNLINILMEDRFTYKMLANTAIRFVFAIMLIKYGGGILGGIIDFSNAVLSEFAGSFTAYEGSVGVDQPAKGALLTMAILVLTLIPKVLTTFSVVITVIATVCKRYVDICLHIFCFPLAVPDLLMEGTRSNTVIYLKKFLALCLQGVVIFCILKFSGYISFGDASSTVSTYVGADGGTVFKAIATTFASFIGYLLSGMLIIGMIRRSESIANDIVGVM